MIVEIEVDTLEQFDEVWPSGPDLVLLDNMGPAELREAVARRNARGRARSNWRPPAASNSGTVRAIAETGVERISVGRADALGRLAGFRPGLAGVRGGCPPHGWRLEGRVIQPLAASQCAPVQPGHCEAASGPFAVTPPASSP